MEPLPAMCPVLQAAVLPGFVPHAAAAPSAGLYGMTPLPTSVQAQAQPAGAHVAAPQAAAPQPAGLYGMTPLPTAPKAPPPPPQQQQQQPLPPPPMPTVYAQQTFYSPPPPPQQQQQQQRQPVYGYPPQAPAYAQAPPPPMYAPPPMPMAPAQSAPAVLAAAGYSAAPAQGGGWGATRVSTGAQPAGYAHLSAAGYSVPLQVPRHTDIKTAVFGLRIGTPKVVMLLLVRNVPLLLHAHLRAVTR
jgi:hypothetical protein